ncbi:MAG TPA: hypothetical protein VGX28_00530 [Frankiaceae bacterium]|nr:hypothetical protein [Frankiaceae bacterium]
MLVITPVRRAPAPLVLCRAVVSTCLTVAALVALATYTAGALLGAPRLVAFAPEAAFGMGLGWGLPFGVVHGVAQLVARSDAAPERPDDTARTAATCVAAVPVVALILASSLMLELLYVAGLAALHGAVARSLAPRWVVWRPVR